MMPVTIPFYFKQSRQLNLTKLIINKIMKTRNFRIIGNTLCDLAHKTIAAGVFLTVGSVVFHAIGDYMSNKNNKR